MTRITFQFIPANPLPNTDQMPNWKSEAIVEVEEKEGMTVIHYSDDLQVEYDVEGDLRFSFDVEDFSKKDLNEFFQTAQERMEHLLDEKEGSYIVCLLLNDENVSSVYLDKIDIIENFGGDEFNNPNPSYTELTDKTIKISFRNTGKYAIA